MRIHSSMTLDRREKGGGGDVLGGGGVGGKIGKKRI